MPLPCFTLVGFIRNSSILLTVFRINIKLYLQRQYEQKPCWPNHCPKITPRLIKLFWIFDYHLSQIIMIIIFTLFQKIIIQIFFVNSTLETLDSCVVIIIIYVIVWSIQIFLFSVNHNYHPQLVWNTGGTWFSFFTSHHYCFRRSNFYWPS